MNLWQYICDEPPKIEAISKHYFYPDRQNRFLSVSSWSINIYDYKGIAYIGGKRYELTPASACIIPPDQTREFCVTRPSLQRVVHFHSNKPKEYHNAMLIPLDKHEHFYGVFEKALAFFPHNPSRARSEIWRLIWELKDMCEMQTSANQGPLESAIKLMEEMDSTPELTLSVNELAKKAGISTNHLIRIFRQHFNTTPGQYIRDKKFQHASYLLKYSDIPINSIACEIGIADLQAFNKFIRKKCGLSPRDLRDKFQKS